MKVITTANWCNQALSALKWASRSGSGREWKERKESTSIWTRESCVHLVANRRAIATSEPGCSRWMVPGSPAHRTVSRRELSLRDSRESSARCLRRNDPRLERVARAEEGCTDSPQRSDVRCSVSTCVVHRREDTRGLERSRWRECGE